MNDSAMHLLLAAMVLAPETARPERGELRRRAQWGFRLSVTADAHGFEVAGLVPGSAAARAGLQEGDRMTRINGQAVRDASALGTHRGGEAMRFEIVRDGHTGAVTFDAPALPEEKLAGCEVRYGEVESSRGYRVRTVLTRPAGAKGKLPVIVFIPWLSCDAVEAPGTGDGWMQMLHGVAEKSGWALYRVEKPGSGDSEGPPCSSNDLETDLAAFRAALHQVRRLDGVDARRVVIFGGSIGGGLAPVLAAEEGVQGVIVAGGFSRTWYEHMLDIERARLTLEGASPADTGRAMRGYATFYDLFLHQRLTPGQVLQRRPDLKPLWDDSPDGQYGRPAAYYHQVAALDVEGAWAKLQVPVLVLHGEYDWIMSRAEADRVGEIVNGRAPEQAEIVILPRTDHHFAVYATPLDAYRERAGHYGDEAVTAITDWLRRRFQGAD